MIPQLLLFQRLVAILTVAIVLLRLVVVAGVAVVEPSPRIYVVEVCCTGGAALDVSKSLSGCRAAVLCAGKR